MNTMPVALAGVWVPSPLIWAIASSPALPPHYTIRDLVGTISSDKSLRVGISRPGSGSHTMAAYLMHTLNSKVNLHYHTAHNFAGLREGKNNIFCAILILNLCKILFIIAFIA